MEFQRMVEQEAKKYTEEILKYKIVEKLLWNEGGVVFLVEAETGERKSLFVTSLENDKIHLKDVYSKIVNDSKNIDSPLVKCESICYKEVEGKDGQVGCYIFIIMEQITPLIEIVLEESFVEIKCNKNQKKIKLLWAMKDACTSVIYAMGKYPEINMFINNEELCLDTRGSTKLLLLDMVKNDICINNQVRELKIIMNQLAKGLGIKVNVDSQNENVEELKKSCEAERIRLENIEKRYEEKFKQNQEQANGNNPVVWYNLGYMYESGKGTYVDYEKAIYWYQKAAEKKNVNALNNLAHIYQKGTGVEKDYAKAMEYLQRAAKLKDSVAQFNLAIIYQTGKGVEKDTKKACYWYKRSMRNGNKTAERMYMRIKSR